MVVFLYFYDIFGINEHKMTISETLDTFDTFDNKNFDEYDVGTALRPLFQNVNNEINEESKADYIAFEFVESFQDNKSIWGTYFGPMYAEQNQDGIINDYPSINFITPSVIDYWSKRANQAINPILKSRYWGLVWDFTKKITEQNPSHEICRKYIHSLIETATGDYFKKQIYVFVRLKRALNLAIELNDNELINTVKNTVIDFETRHFNENNQHQWDYSFDLLLENKRVKFSELERSNIISKLETKLLYFSDNIDIQKNDIWVSEETSKRLANFYRKNHKTNDVRRVILQVGKTYEFFIKNDTSFKSFGYLNHLYSFYMKFNLKEDAELILLKIRELGPKANSELIPLTHTIEFSKVEIDDYFDSMITGSPSEILFSLTVQFIPIKETIKGQISELFKKAPLSFLLTKKIHDEKGRLITTIGSLQNDLDGHIAHYTSNNLNITSIFLREFFSRVIKNKLINKKDLLSFIQNTPIISNDRYQIIEKGLDAYFQKDYLIFIHLIIPQIEDSIRNMVELAGGQVLKQSKDGGGFRLRTFDDILRSNEVTEIAGEDFANYFRILFTDQRGWNLRNSVCHGMASSDMFSSNTADRVLHALLCLGLFIKVV